MLWFGQQERQNFSPRVRDSRRNEVLRYSESFRLAKDPSFIEQYRAGLDRQILQTWTATGIDVLLQYKDEPILIESILKAIHSEVHPSDEGIRRASKIHVTAYQVKAYGQPLRSSTIKWSEDIKMARFSPYVKQAELSAEDLNYITSQCDPVELNHLNSRAYINVMFRTWRSPQVEDELEVRLNTYLKHQIFSP